MCGLVGIFHTKNRSLPDEALLTRMNDSLYHRGPDEGGIHREPGIGLGHRRLSIIDLSSGHQPLFNEDHSIVVVFNGEIYNFVELMPELKALGHVFRTHCDTEVIVHAWEEWGVKCLDRFRGMFAFALWDRNRQQLFLARDRLGVKPLYYSLHPDGRIAFASELKALRIIPDFDRRIDPCAIEDYFAFGYVPEPRTIYHNAFKLEPGHYLLLSANQPLPTPQPYWDIPFAPTLTLSLEEAQTELIQRLREAIRIRLVAEVPLGAFLSGGVDSSAVVAMMAELSADPVNTCSIAFKDKQFNEAHYADQIARQYGTRHQVSEVDPDDFSLIDQLAALYDEPYADSSALPTYRVCELAKKTVTVALSGDGGDENLAGYRRYRFHMAEERLRRTLPQGLRSPLFGTLGRLYPKADWAPRVFRAKSTFQALARNSVDGYFHSVSLMSDSLRQRLFSPALLGQLQGYRASDVFARHAKNCPTSDPLSLIQYLDIKTYLPGDILTKVDRASMAHALEVREPLLDHSLMEWVSCLPPHFKLFQGEGKYVFKKALEPYLPNDILYRPKMGFAVPLANWFRGPLRGKVRDAVLGNRLMESGYFNPSFLHHLVDEHQSGRRDYSAPLWSLLMFDSFLGL